MLLDEPEYCGFTSLTFCAWQLLEIRPFYAAHVLYILSIEHFMHLTLALFCNIYVCFMTLTVWLEDNGLVLVQQQ